MFAFPATNNVVVKLLKDHRTDDIGPVAFKETDLAAVRQMANILGPFPKIVINDMGPVVMCSTRGKIVFGNAENSPNAVFRMRMSNGDR